LSLWRYNGIEDAPAEPSCKQSCCLGRHPTGPAINQRNYLRKSLVLEIMVHPIVAHGLVPWEMVLVTGHPCSLQSTEDEQLLLATGKYSGFIGCTHI